eukprot:PhM_4_TR11579/c0_g1_i1/m.29191
MSSSALDMKRSPSRDPVMSFVFRPLTNAVTSFEWIRRVREPTDHPAFPSSKDTISRDTPPTSTVAPDATLVMRGALATKKWFSWEPFDVLMMNTSPVLVPATRWEVAGTHVSVHTRGMMKPAPRFSRSVTRSSLWLIAEALPATTLATSNFCTTPALSPLNTKHSSGEKHTLNAIIAFGCFEQRPARGRPRSVVSYRRTLPSSCAAARKFVRRAEDRIPPPVDMTTSTSTRCSVLNSKYWPVTVATTSVAASMKWQLRGVTLRYPPVTDTRSMTLPSPTCHSSTLQLFRTTARVLVSSCMSMHATPTTRRWIGAGIAERDIFCVGCVTPLKKLKVLLSIKYRNCNFF